MGYAFHSPSVYHCLFTKICLYCLWYVTLITWLPSPSVMPAVFSLALIAPVSASYSTKAIPLLPGTSRTSRKPSNLPKIAVRASISYSSGRFCTKSILFGGRYSSGTTADVAAFEDFSPAPLEALTGRADASATAPAATADLFSLLVSSAASAAFFLSVMH